MKLYHVTTRENLQGIQASGIRVDHAQGVEQAIWLCVETKIHWAITHTQKRHHAGLEDIIVLVVNVQRSHLRRAWKGLWKCYSDLLTFQVAGTGPEYAQSPLG